MRSLDMGNAGYVFSDVVLAVETNVASLNPILPLYVCQPAGSNIEIQSKSRNLHIAELIVFETGPQCPGIATASYLITLISLWISRPIWLTLSLKRKVFRMR